MSRFIGQISSSMRSGFFGARRTTRLGWTTVRRSPHADFRLDAETPLKDVSISGAISSDLWAWVELNYRPHAYQATEGV